jgi:hypothetical protein
MRKSVGIFFFVFVLLAPVGVLSAAPAGAASGTTCKSMGGSGMFSPTLPRLGSSAKVKSVLNATGSISGCTGSVSSGSVRFVSARSGAENCKTLGVPPTAPIKGTEVITWNSGATSTIAFKFADVAASPVTTQALTGTVTAGLFKGLHQKGKLMYSPVGGGCTSIGLSRISYSSAAAMTIK